MRTRTLLAGFNIFGLQDAQPAAVFAFYLGVHAVRENAVSFIRASSHAHMRAMTVITTFIDS